MTWTTFALLIFALITIGLTNQVAELEKNQDVISEALTKLIQQVKQNEVD